MSDGHRLVQLMRQAGKPPQNEIVDIVIGEVTSVKPLKVKVANRELTESFLILGALCKETHISSANIKNLNHYHTVDAMSTQSAGEYSHSHQISSHDTTSTHEEEGYDIMLWRGLMVGDRVFMLKVGRGQKYYLLQREEGVIPT